MNYNYEKGVVFEHKFPQVGRRGKYK